MYNLDMSVFHFNPRSREGSDDSTAHPLTVTVKFQSTLPRRERLRYMRGIAAELLFQSTLPRRERPAADWITSIANDFNPRSREGSDVTSSVTLASPTYFNPRSREGSDTKKIIDVSYHNDFNPRSREGSDDSPCPPVPGLTGFQSTLPRRERRNGVRQRVRVENFNPRSREGSDFLAEMLVALYAGFQSTLPRRERLSCLFPHLAYLPFQSTLPRRERLCLL